MQGTDQCKLCSIPFHVNNVPFHSCKLDSIPSKVGSIPFHINNVPSISCGNYIAADYWVICFCSNNYECSWESLHCCWVNARTLCCTARVACQL